MATIKFSEFDAGNINAVGAQIVGLEGGNNKRFTASELVNGLATVTYVDAQDAGLQSQITQNTNDIAAIDPANINANIATLQGQVTVLEGNVVVLEGAVAALENNVSINQDDITVIRGNIVAIENELANIADTDAQNLSWDGANANLSISNGNNVVLQEVLDNAGNITVMQGQIADLQANGNIQTLSLDNSSNVLSISGGNTVDFTTVLGNVAGGGGGGLPANVNITTEDITLTVTSNADLANLQNVIATYRLTSSLDQDGSRPHAPIIYVDVSPGSYAVNDYFSIEHMIPNVRFRSNGGDATDTIMVFNEQVNIIDSTVRFDGVDVNFPYQLNVTDNSWVGLGMSTQMKFESDYFTIYRGSRVESKNCEFRYTYFELSQNSLFWSGSNSNWAGTASDWWLLDTSKVHLEGSGGTNLFDFNDVASLMQSEFYARHVGGVTVSTNDILVDDQSKAYIRSSAGNIDCARIDLFDTSDLHLEATNVNTTSSVNLRYISRLSVTGAINVTGEVNVLETSTFTADNLTIAGTDNLNIFTGSTVAIEDRCIAPFIDMEGSTLIAAGDTSSSDGDIYTRSLTADFGSMVAAKNDIRESTGVTTTEINLMDSKLVANKILNCGQLNMFSSDLRSEDGIQFSETNGQLQAYGSIIAMEGPISQVADTAGNNGILLSGSELMIGGFDSGTAIKTSFMELTGSRVKVLSDVELCRDRDTGTALVLRGTSELSCDRIKKENAFYTDNTLNITAEASSRVHTTNLGDTTTDGLNLTANITLSSGSRFFVTENSTANNIGNSNIVVQTFSEFFSPLGRVSDYL